MTAGYGSADTGPAGPGDGGFPPGTARPGPLPPRIEPTAPAYLPPGAPRPPSAAPSPRPAWSPPAQPGQWGTAPASPTAPPAPTAAPAASGWGHGGTPSVAPGTATPPRAAPGPGWPAASAPLGAAGQPPAHNHPPVPGPGQPYPSGAAQVGAVPAAKGRGLTVTALVLAGLLAVVTGVQAFQIHRLSDRLGDTDSRLAAAQAADGTRLEGLESRAGTLEKQAGAAFNPEAVASAVLPSVFRVRAGNSTGTAFAIGKPAAGGGTNLFTNYHVVDALWQTGEREVFLERTDQRFPATIVRVDEANDVAHLRTNGKFTGLVAAPAAVKSGQQIVVVGAPLGLEDSVTTGVVSAFREAGGGEGPVIQFDAPINPGNSGGPVINGSKQVVGIATAKARDAEGIGLAVPIKVACDGFKIC
ncbi:trypsin-like peptidase domain-containing protein [Micromonospora peucetia]|uniref:S1C family serine protease n=1 Tax=Micromonospora peucetia TaxID=47871 RepID=UPI0022511C21|nr:trypsin-like peptidase domain-containing protein [Micromonospora peucetia]MCX4385900.1 trypsin-like peptidase domain-containing protein [Micromonospora peucetia]